MPKVGIVALLLVVEQRWRQAHFRPGTRTRWVAQELQQGMETPSQMLVVLGLPACLPP